MVGSCFAVKYLTMIKNFCDVILKPYSKYFIFFVLTNWPNKIVLNYIRLEKLAMNKHSSLLGPIIRYEKN